MSGTRISTTVFLFVQLFSWLAPAECAPPVAMTSAEVVPHEHWEFWVSSNYEKTGEKEALKPTLEIIYGVVPRVEISFETAYLYESERGRGVDGLDFVNLQIKIESFHEKEFIPAVAFKLFYEVPAEPEENRLMWSDEEWAWAVAVQKNFGRIKFISNIKYVVDSMWRYGADLFYKWDEGLKLIAEIYAEEHLNSGKKNELNFRAGFRYQITKNLIVYFAGGRSVLPVELNRPRFEGNGGILFEY